MPAVCPSLAALPAAPAPAASSQPSGTKSTLKFISLPLYVYLLISRRLQTHKCSFTATVKLFFPLERHFIVAWLWEV